MSVKRKVKVYFEKNRSGEFKKIHVYKDKDQEDTTLGFWVKLPNNEMVKVGEYIFTEDMELPDPEPEPEPEPTPEPKAPVIDLDENQNIAGNTGQDITMTAKITDPNGNATIKEVSWKQTLPEEPAPQVILNISPDKQTVIFKTDVEGDYLFTVTAVDDTGLSASAGVNVKVRTQIPEPEPDPTAEFIPAMAAFGDCNSSSDAVSTFANVSALQVPVLALGDFEYDSDFNDFKAKLGSLKEKIKAANKGNHDDTESESQSIEDANSQFWGWGAKALTKTTIDNIGIVAMDTQDSDILNKSGEQYKFVEAALKEYASKDWRVVTMHKPLRCPKTKHGEETDVRALYEPLFNQYGVALILYGHNHNQWLSKSIGGTIHAGSGNAGRDLYQIDSNPAYIEWSQDNDFGYVVIEQKKDKTQLKIKFLSNAKKVLKEALVPRFNVPIPPTHECPEGQQWDEAQQKCVDKVPEPEPQPTGDADKFGNPFFHKSKVGGYFLEQSTNPQAQEGFDHIDEDFKVNGNVITMIPNGPTSFGVGRNIRIFDDAIDGCTMKFPEVAARGFAFKENDVRDLEFKCLVSVKGIGDHGISISCTTGHHDDGPNGVCCQGFAYMFNIDSPTQSPIPFRFRKEMWHVSYHTSPEGTFTHPKFNFKLEGHGYIGIGVCRYNKGDRVVLEGWANPDPIADPKNWIMIKRIEDFKGKGWGDDGDKCGGAKDQVGTWSSAQNRLKTNATSGTVDIQAISFREIDPSLD